MDSISVVTPTYNRTAPLVRALASLMAQQGLHDLAPEIIVVDNSPDANARATIASFAKNSRFPLYYISEPRPGVANARNAGVAAAKGRWVAFLDDDEEADPYWLAALAKVARAQNADAVFGPVSARADGDADLGEFGSYFERKIERGNGSDITDLAAYLGTNNSLFDRASCLSSAQNFDPSLNESGGEDSLLLRRLALGGKRFFYADEAKVTEWAPPRRLTWSYVKKRKFLSGQIRVFVQQMARPEDILAICRWMAIGLAQVVIFGAAAVLLTPFGQARRQRMSVKALGGLGKIFWTRRFRLALYGRGLVS